MVHYISTLLLNFRKNELRAGQYSMQISGLNGSVLGAIQQSLATPCKNRARIQIQKRINLLTQSSRVSGRNG